LNRPCFTDKLSIMIRKKILVIDDEPEMAELLKMRLEPKGYDVEVSYCGKEGLEKAKDVRPDAVLLDIMMPNMDGLEVLRDMRKNPNTRNLPIIMITAKSDTGSIFKSKDLRATDYIIKPIDLVELEKMLELYI